jgi:hypothetical protein
MDAQQPLERADDIVAGKAGDAVPDRTKQRFHAVPQAGHDIDADLVHLPRQRHQRGGHVLRELHHSRRRPFDLRPERDHGGRQPDDAGNDERDRRGDRGNSGRHQP